MDELDCFAPRGKLVPGKQFPRQRIGKRSPKILKRCVDDPPHHPRGNAANGFVNRDDAADLGGVRLPGVQQFVFRIDHLNPARSIWIEFRFAVKDDPLPCFEFSFEIEPVKKLAGKRTGIVADEQVIHAAPRACITYQAAAQDLRLHGVDLTRHNLADFREPDAVLITERQVTEEVLERSDAALREQLRAAGSHAFEIHHFSCGRQAHLYLYITAPLYVLLLAIALRMRKDGALLLELQEECLSLERLTGNDKKVLLIWILAGLLGAGVAHRYFFQAFPEASVEFKVPRGAALEQARQFASAQGAQLNGYQSSIIFQVDDAAKTYLEREVGLKQANHMMTQDVHIWYWQTRFFRPLQKEEFDVRVDPAGGIVGYTHEMEETAPGARLERGAAQTAAESFLRDTLQLDLSRYDFREEEANSSERPNRRDWSFSWERRGFRAKDAPYRLNVTLAGDRVNGYEEFLKVPEAWKIDYEHLRSSNNFFEYIALLPYAFLLGGCLYVIISLGRRGLLEWRAGIALGIFLTALYFIMTMNQWPLDRASYDTNTPYSSFFLSHVGQAALISVVSAFLVVLAIVPGEPLYRVSQPDKIRLDGGLQLPGLRTKEFFRANVIGICMAAAHIGYITVFYIISRKLGAWAPQDLNYENVVSTWLPWVYPLAIGIYAATSEEFLFRLFAIPYLMRLTKSRFLAVVLPAFAWGFLHSNYPQEPAYIRGIEVGLIGIVAGLVMLRWGIWATLTWHYTVDAFLISTSLLRSEGIYLRVSGAIVGGAAFIPLAIAAISYLSRGGFEADPELLNSARLLAAPQADTMLGTAGTLEPEIVLESAAAEASQGYAPMSPRALVILTVCGVLGIALLAGVKRDAIGDFVRFAINAGEATTRADQVLRDHKVDPASYQPAATITYTFDGYTNEYLRRTIGITAANVIYRDQVPSAFWTIRYFRDSQIEEYMIVLRTDGSLHSLHHTLDEKAPGANLTKEEALGRAEAYLLDQKKIDLSLWN